MGVIHNNFNLHAGTAAHASVDNPGLGAKNSVPPAVGSEQESHVVPFTLDSLPIDLHRQILSNASPNFQSVFPSERNLRRVSPEFYALHRTNHYWRALASEKISDVQHPRNKDDATHAPSVAHVVKAYPQLQNYTFRRGTPTLQNFTDLRTAKQLTGVHVLLPDDMPPENIVPLAELTKLTSLSLCGVDGLRNELITKFVALKGLRNLSVSGEHTVPLETIAKFKKLRKLYYTFRTLRDADVAPLATMPSLEEIDLSGTHELSSRGAQDLSRIENLRSISLQKITGAQLRILAENKKLEEVSAVGPNDISDSDIHAISRHPRLRKLWLFHSPEVTRSGLAALANMPALKDAHFEVNNHISEKDVDELRARLRNGKNEPT